MPRFRRRAVHHQTRVVPAPTPQRPTKKETLSSSSSPAMRKLSSDEYSKVLVKGIAKDETELNTKYTQKYKAKILNKDLRTLRPNKQIQREIIEVYLRLIAKGGKKEKTYVFDCKFQKNLLTGKIDELVDKCQKINLTEMRMILIPIRISNWFALLVINNDEQTFKLYGFTASMSFITKLFSKCQSFMNELNERLGKPKIEYSTDATEYSSIVRSNDSIVFALMIARFLINNISLGYIKKGNIERFRNIMTLEIINGSLTRLYNN
ncbi:hypothetical protein KGF54_002029 [Candida jiufengensis]|uniref:uncharacterized protein n=1 Tax=Candida jiufengensis TaxID=497108 RepID=UPI0022251780|nr:uncharacterized protein KGF54_002029 [Candida jiufengensis]KAI5954254.1 hypothetical protein KGF54_002029 [Candida jiufengensis]